MFYVEGEEVTARGDPPMWTREVWLPHPQGCGVSGSSVTNPSWVYMRDIHLGAGQVLRGKSQSLGGVLVVTSAVDSFRPSTKGDEDVPRLPRMRPMGRNSEGKYFIL